jgi:hypothetical protein
MYFTQNCKKLWCILSTGIWPVLFLCVLSFSPLVSNAQPAVPVDAGFFGEWIFDHAQAQERPVNSQQSYVMRSVLQDEFWQKPYLLDIPTRIVFMGAFMTHISHPSWSRPVVAVINPANSGKLEFRNFRKNPEDYNKIPELSEIDSYPVIMPAHSLTLNGDFMSLQCNYTSLDASGKHIEGILTIYYKRF